jgi:hypothetical protein
MKLQMVLCVTPKCVILFVQIVVINFLDVFKKLINAYVVYCLY